MENNQPFVVSARKYRPQTFDTVVGQQHITQTLIKAIQHNQVAHAYLFCGPRGVGKTTCARILAKNINCLNILPNGEACGECNACQNFSKSATFNVIELDAASNNSVEDVRKITEQVRFPPQNARYKVFIIDEVHMLSSGAFNALLKTLEEPPPYVIFILATTEKQKILPTILSRCQIFDFKRIHHQDIVDHLQQICVKENIQAEVKALQIIAQKTEGCMRDALTILDKISSFSDAKISYDKTIELLNVLDASFFKSLTIELLNKNIPQAINLLNDVYFKGFELEYIISGLAEFYRTLLLMLYPNSAVLTNEYINNNDDLTEWVKTIDPSFVLSALNNVIESEWQIKNVKNKKLFTEMLFIKIAYINDAIKQAPNNAKKTSLNNALVTMRALPLSKYLPITEPIPSQQKKSTTTVTPTITTHNTTSTTKTITSNPIFSISSLQSIKQNVLKEHTANASILLTNENIKIYIDEWIIYCQKNNMMMEANLFKEIHFKNVNQLIIECEVNDLFTKNFIEKEGKKWIDFLYKKTYNRYQIKAELAVLSTENQPLKTMNNQQLYETLISDYPIIFELKEKLKLNLY